MDIVDNIYSIWQFSLSFFILTFAMLGIYFWYHRSIKLDKSAFFLAVSLIAATLATASPIGVLADGYAFTAHMLQHMLLLLVVTQFFFFKATSASLAI